MAVRFPRLNVGVEPLGVNAARVTRIASPVLPPILSGNTGAPQGGAPV